MNCRKVYLILQGKVQNVYWYPTTHIYLYISAYISILLWPRRCHCTRQPLVYGCSPHSHVLCPACGLQKCHMQFTGVLSDHVDPSFLLSSPLSDSMYIAIVCYFGVSFILHPIQMSKVS